MSSLRIVCISDTHLQHYLPHRIKIPDGDILIHAGDGTFDGSVSQIIEWLEWMSRIEIRHKVFIAGNHDWLFQNDSDRTSRILSNRFGDLIYLEDSETTVEGLRIYGSPWQPEFCNWAFNLERGEPLRRKWEKIPDGIDILVTHGPPKGYGDKLKRGERVGCDDLLDAVRRVKPKLHVVGHIHQGYGAYRIDGQDTQVVNASICDEIYEPSNQPIVVELSKGEES